MRQSRLRRANLLLLALLLGGGGSGLPLLDAALHHFGVVRRPGAQMHGCEAGATHAERCTLGIALPALAGARREPTRLPPAPLATLDDVSRGTRRVAGTPVFSPSLPRAPPVPPVR